MRSGAAPPPPEVRAHQVVNRQEVQGDVHNFFYFASGPARQVVGAVAKRSVDANSPETAGPSLTVPGGKSVLGPFGGDTRFLGYTVCLDLVGSEERIRRYQESLPPGKDAHEKVRQWLDRTLREAVKHASLDFSQLPQRKDRGDGYFLLVPTADSAHLLTQTFHAASRSGRDGIGAGARWLFRAGIARGAADVTQTPDGRLAFASEVVGEALRLEQSAQSGGTVICPETYPDLSPHFRILYDDVARPFGQPGGAFTEVWGHGLPKKVG